MATLITEYKDRTATPRVTRNITVEDAEREYDNRLAFDPRVDRVLLYDGVDKALMMPLLVWDRKGGAE